MRDNFETRLKQIEQELLDLKTASEYTSIRTSNIKTSEDIYTGLYQIVYNNDGESIVSMVYKGRSDFCRLYPRTPSGNSQIVEVQTTRWNNSTQTYDNFTNNLVVISNVPVVSITRL